MHCRGACMRWMVLPQACSSTSRSGKQPFTGSSQAFSTPRMPPPRRSSCQSFRRTFCTTWKPGSAPHAMMGTVHVLVHLLMLVVQSALEQHRHAH